MGDALAFFCTADARFVQQLIDLIESGYGLDDSTLASEQAVALETSKKSQSGPHLKEEL